MIDIKSLHQELETISTFSSGPEPGVTRVMYTPEDMEARAYFVNLCNEAGLHVRVDPMGNTFARWVGEKAHLPAVGTGSHIDAIPHSGKFDGTVGVLGGLEAIRFLQRHGFRPQRSIELLLFTSEEPTRFGLGCIGSRALSGLLKPTKLAGLRDLDGNTLDEIRSAVGLKGNLDEVPLPKEYYHAFVELHIEQGPILEAEGVDIGIVTKIAAPSTLRVYLHGTGGHAGCVLMPDRRDASCAAAEIVLAVEKLAANSPSIDTVATTGVFMIEPGAVNSIPSTAYLEIDLRDTDMVTRDEVLAKLQSEIQRICSNRNITEEVEIINCDPPVICDEHIVVSAENAAKQLGYSSKRMISRAYHDSLFMAQLFPTAMLFIPCKEGISHRPEEYSSAEQIAKGVHTLALTLKQLAINI